MVKSLSVRLISIISVVLSFHSASHAASSTQISASIGGGFSDIHQGPVVVGFDLGIDSSLTVGGEMAIVNPTYGIELAGRLLYWVDHTAFKGFYAGPKIYLGKHSTSKDRTNKDSFINKQPIWLVNSKDNSTDFFGLGAELGYAIAVSNKVNLGVGADLSITDSISLWGALKLTLGYKL